jgi:hypothetical protein
LGIQHGPLFAYVGYGFGDNGASNLALNGVPFSEQEIVANVEYQMNFGKLGVNLGGWFDESTGFNQTTWDAAAVMCTGAAGTIFFANTAASPFATCGPGRATPTYANGTPITGYYLSPIINAVTPITGLAGVGQASPVIGGHVVLTDGKFRAQFVGAMRTGNDPYTGAAWLGNLSGDVQLDLGPIRSQKGNAGQWTYEAQAFAFGFNGQNQSSNVVGGPVLYNSFTTNWNDTYWAEAGVKYWINDYTYASLAYGHTGLLPNVLLPIGSTCPGCVVSGLTQNMVFAQVNMNF